MTNVSTNAYQKQGKVFSEWVWFEGSTALLEGQGVCYNWDYNRTDGSAAGAYPERMNRVEVPTVLNARFFAGVTARAYSACTGGQYVEIYRPGSVCNILTKVSSTIGVGIYTCEAGGTYAGYFRYAGFQGEGSAVPLQTVDNSSAAASCLAFLQPGLPSGLVEVFDNDVGGAQTGYMVGGVTYLDCGTLEAHATFTLADGTIEGLRKKFIVLTDQGASYNFVLTINGIVYNGVEEDAVSTATMNNVADSVVVEWSSGDWVLQSSVGCTVA